MRQHRQWRSNPALIPRRAPSDPASIRPRWQPHGSHACLQLRGRYRGPIAIKQGQHVVALGKMPPFFSWFSVSPRLLRRLGLPGWDRRDDAGEVMPTGFLSRPTTLQEMDISGWFPTIRGIEGPGAEKEANEHGPPPRLVFSSQT